MERREGEMTFVDELQLELENFDEKLLEKYAPYEPFDEAKEEILCTITSPRVMALYSLAEQFKTACYRKATDGMCAREGDQKALLTSEALTLANKKDAAQAVFFASCRAFPEAFGSHAIGIRQGWKLVRSKCGCPKCTGMEE